MEVSVESVEATNLNQVKVVFTQKVDEDAAEDVTNYEVDGKNWLKMMLKLFFKMMAELLY